MYKKSLYLKDKFQDPKLIWKDAIYTLFKAQVFTVATKLKVISCTLWLHKLNSASAI